MKNRDVTTPNKRNPHPNRQKSKKNLKSGKDLWNGSGLEKHVRRTSCHHSGHVRGKYWSNAAQAVVLECRGVGNWMWLSKTASRVHLRAHTNVGWEWENARKAKMIERQLARKVGKGRGKRVREWRVDGGLHGGRARLGGLSRKE